MGGLKSLELHGYKTFASRTLFEFAPTVTAVVGPNGSGKSNIADSLRWVLGEQSYALLRGKKTEDMIFAGSEHRPRAGMASATITFDNCDGWLPIDFSEVAITRRAYRDGTNEYLINGQRMRLKDVSELLAQSGLAERTYTIIGQGLVDAALALKAEERRRLFEEAAGIGLHRTRREEALHRLETTKRNLERVEDILAELSPRLRSLERQARRAQEYESIKADLRVGLREWYGYHWHLSQKELNEARDMAQHQEVRLEKARQEQAVLAESLGGVRERIQGLRASLNSWHRQSAQYHSQREGLSRSLAVADERLRSLQEQQSSAGAQVARLEEEVGLYLEQVDSAALEMAHLDEELSEARRQVETARKALSTRQAERARVEKEVQNARQALSGSTSRQGQVQARLAERQAQAERAQKALQNADQAVKAAEAELQAAQKRVEATLVNQKEAEAERQAADAAVQQQRQALASKEAERRETQEQRSQAAAEQARLKAQLEVLDQAEASLTGYAGGTRYLLQEARKSRLQAARGALSSALDVPAEIETAVATALGDYLDAVVLDDDPDAALDLLAQAGQQAARAVLLPLKALKPRPPLEPALKEIEGVVGIAADLVQAAPEIRPAVDLLLGQVVVVQDRRSARRALAALDWNGPDAASLSAIRIVTLKGELFLASGPVHTSGSGAVNTVLSRSRQRRELGEQRQQAEQRMRLFDERVSAIDKELKALQAEGERLVQDQRNARQQVEKQTMAANQAKMAADQAAKQVRWQQDQRQNLQNDLKRGEAEAAQLQKELNGIQTEIDQARERLRQHNNALAGLALDEFLTQVNHWNTQVAVAERALGDSKGRYRERQAALERARQAVVAQQKRQGEVKQALAALDEEKAGWRAAEGEIGEKIEALRVLIDPAEAELEGLEGEQAELQNTETAARQALSVAEHHHAQAKIGLARRQEALESLRRRIEEDFGIVAFEYADNVSGPTPLPLEGMVEQLPSVPRLSPELEENIKRLRAQLRRMGAINAEAQAEYVEVRDRHAFMTSQVADLHHAEAGIREVIQELDGLMQREFKRTFEAVAVEFRGIFTRLFGGGSARLVLTDPGDLTNTGIDIEARLPGRRTQGLSLLSGGERSLTAVALVFALLKVSPTPFCVFDEVDAMLDEANVGRFRDLLRELSGKTQFVVVTHNRNTVQAADVIYGITMGRDSASQQISLRLDQVSELIDGEEGKADG